jgi:pectate lyase
MVRIESDNVIWRYTRIRKGLGSGCDGVSNIGSTINMYNHDIILDHNSTSWNCDEGISTVGWAPSLDPRNLTVSSNLIAEGLDPHSTSMMSGGDNAVNQINFDIIRNLVMNDNHRNPLLKNKSSRIVNNIWYNQKRYVNQLKGGISADVIGNLYKQGPLNRSFVRKPWDFHEIQIAARVDADTAPGIGSIYLSGNKGWYQTNPSSDQWLMTNDVPSENADELTTGPASTATKRLTPLADTTYPITAISVNSLEANLLPLVGASRRLDCDGSWVLNRDSVDTRLITQYETDTGISALVTNESQVGGFPTIAAGTACSDKDKDGMSDIWEENHGLNPNNPENRNTIAPNSYTYLENFLNGL